jgi:hypothetical protein
MDNTVSNLEQKESSAVWDSKKGSCSEALGGAAGQNRERLEEEEKGPWKWCIPLYGSSFRGTWRGAPLSGALKVMKGRLWE